MIIKIIINILLKTGSRCIAFRRIRPFGKTGSDPFPKPDPDPTKTPDAEQKPKLRIEPILSQSSQSTLIFFILNVKGLKNFTISN